MPSRRPPRPDRDPTAAPGPYVAVQLAPVALIQAAWRVQPETRTVPLVIASDTRVILAVGPGADGVHPGQSLTQARLLAPDLVVAPPDGVTANLLYDDLLRLLTGVSPVVEDTDRGQGVALLDAHGCAALWGWGEDGWTGYPLAHDVRVAATAQSLSVRAGCAHTPFLARLLCSTARPGTVVAPSPPEATAVMHALSLGDPALGLSAPLVSTLDVLGLRTVHDLLRLSHAAVVERCGPEAGLLWRRLAGETVVPLRRWTPPAIIVLDRTEIACANTLVLDALTDEMCLDLHRRLAASGHAVAELTLRLTLESDAQHVRYSRHWPPLHAAASLQCAVRDLRERCPVAAAVTAVTIQASALQAPATRQSSLWTAESERRGERLAAVLDAYARKTGAGLAKRWRADPLSPDGWTREEA